MVIPDFVGYYVSRTGQMYSDRKWMRGSVSVVDEAFRHPVASFVGDRGYVRACLRVAVGGKHRSVSRTVHQMVLRAWVGPPPFKGAMCRHLDGVKTNNSLDNLAWGTSKENHADRELHGSNWRGEHHPSAKLTDAKVREIRRLAKAGMSGADIGRKFGISGVSAVRVIRGLRWKHVAVDGGVNDAS